MGIYLGDIDLRLRDDLGYCIVVFFFVLLILSNILEMKIEKF